MSRRGFTLTEALLALSILGIALAAVMPSFITVSDANRLDEQRWGAVAAAQQAAESLRLEDPGLLPMAGQAPVQIVPVGGREYEVLTSFCTTPAYCGADSRHVLIEVRHAGRIVYTVETVYTRLR